MHNTLILSLQAMKKIGLVAVSVYFLAGILFLQQGDFCSLTDMPAMYLHCKATEDKDLTPLDFITDHLLDLDCIIDQHDNGDPQKPHMPLQCSHENCPNIFIPGEFEDLAVKPIIPKQKFQFRSEKSDPKDYNERIFRPPVC